MKIFKLIFAGICPLICMIYPSNTRAQVNVGIGTTTPQSLFSVGSGSQFQVDGSGDIKKINNIPYSFPSSQGANGQVLSNNGSGILSWIATNPSAVIVINSSNYLSITPSEDKIYNVQGTITLSATYNNLNKNNLLITGGTFDGNNTQIINFSSNSIISGVNFNNIQIDGSSSVQFVNCKFNNVTSLPFRCSLTGCQINSSVFTDFSSIGYIDNSLISASTIRRLNRVSNCLISNTTLGSTSSSFSGIELMSNNTINDSYIYLSGNFTGNNCDETQISVRAASQPVALVGNSFITSLLPNFIEVNLNTANRVAVNISNNNFEGNTSFPGLNYIRIYGSYTGTRSITKISNNIAIGGTGTFISSEHTGSSVLMINDNDLLYTGGIGVSQGGLTSLRNNIVH